MMNVYRYASGSSATSATRKTCVVELELDIEEDDLLPTISHRQQMKQHIPKDSYPDSDELHDSLEEGVVLDSGVGSSSEKPISVSDEIARFQQEILKAEEEKCRNSTWQKLRANRRGSVDSAMDADSDASSIPPSLPPKSRFKSEDNLPPPALPPKKKSGKKRISFSTEEATVFGSDQESVSSNSPSSSTSPTSSTSSVFCSQDLRSDSSFCQPPKQQQWMMSSVSDQNQFSISKNNKNAFNSKENTINNMPPQQKNNSKLLPYQNNMATSKQSNNQLLKQNNIPMLNKNNNCFNKQNNISLERTRQIQPQTHLAPQDPPEPVDIELKKKDLNDGVEDAKQEERDPSPILPSVRDLASKFLQKEIPEPKPRVLLQKKQGNGEKNPEMLKVKKEKYHQVHSLTARSVSREFREGLRQGKPFMTDTIVKLPVKPFMTESFTKEDLYDDQIGEDSSHVVNNNQVAKVNVVYDSVRNNDMFPDGEYIRTPSPEHVGIPAGPLKMPMRRLESTDGYTSEESNGSFPPASQRHPPARRKMKPPPIDKNVWA